MKKRILLSVTAIALVLGLVLGGTFAYFSDKEVSTGNTLTAGIVDLEIGGISELPVSLEDMKPCDWEYVPVRLKKGPGSNDGPAYMHIKNVRTNDGDRPESETGPVGRHDIDNWITVDLIIDTNGNQAYDEGVDEVIIPADAHIKLGDLECIWIPLGWVDAPLDFLLSFHLQAETDNRYQGDQCTFDIEFLMTDHNSPAPTPSMIVLENKNPSTWEPIDDDTWGLAFYDVGSLNLVVYATGLTPGQDYQVGITSPEDATWYPVSGGEDMRKEMASALASGVYSSTTGTAPAAGYNLYERGYSSGGVYHGTYAAGDVGGFNTSKNGVTPRTITADSSGKFTEKVSFPLPSGDYEFIKVTVKEDQSPWDAILMEKDTPMFFTIP